MSVSQLRRQQKSYYNHSLSLGIPRFLGFYLCRTKFYGVNTLLLEEICSMQMLTDWSRTRFLNVVFTSNIITSHVSDLINSLLVRYSYMSYLCAFDYRINPSNNIFTYVLSVDAIVLYLKDLQGRPKYAQF
jgi:hypothetical protein